MSAAPPLRPGAALAVGAAAGLLSGLLGIGGGLVVGPVLALLGMPLPRALGTSLVAVAPIAAVAALAGWKTAPDQLAWTTALLVAVGGQLGAPLGARLLVSLPVRALRMVFIGFLLLAASRNLIGPPEWQLEGLAVAGSWPHSALVLALGVGAGVCSSLFGVGGGVVVVPGLVYLAGGFSFPAAAATSLLAMIPTALRGAWIARRQDRIEAGVARWLVPSAAVAAVLAVYLRDLVLPPVFLARLFGLFLVYAAWRLWQLGRAAPLRASGAAPDPRSRRRS